MYIELEFYFNSFNLNFKRLLIKADPIYILPRLTIVYTPFATETSIRY